MPIYPAGYQCCRCLCQLVSSCLLKGEIVVWGTSGITEMLRLLPLGKQVLHILMNDPWSIDSGTAKQLTNKQTNDLDLGAFGLMADHLEIDCP